MSNWWTEDKTGLPTFTIVQNYIMDFDGDLTEHEKFVFIELKRFYGEIFPSLSTIARLCRISKKTAQRALDGLLAKGYITKERRYDKRTGSNKSNLYVLDSTPERWNSPEAPAEDTAKNALASASDADLLAELRRRGIFPEAEKTESSAENPDNITYMEKAPVLSTDQSESTDTPKTTASNEEGLLFSDYDSTETIENATPKTQSADNVAMITAEIERTAPGMLTAKDRTAAAKELIKVNPGASVDILCSMAAELTARTDKAYHAGKVRRPIAYLITSIQRAQAMRSSEAQSNPAPMGGSLTHEKQSSKALQAILNSMKDDDGGGGNGG